jgi:ABC-2 type transport system permease protein
LPTSLFPDKLLAIAQYNPIYHMNESLVGLWAKGDTAEAIADHLWFLGIFAVIMIFGGWLSYYRMLQTERQL